MQTVFRKVAESLDWFPTRNRREFIENEFPAIRHYPQLGTPALHT